MSSNRVSLDTPVLDVAGSLSELARTTRCAARNKVKAALASVGPP